MLLPISPPASAARLFAGASAPDGERDAPGRRASGALRKETIRQRHASARAGPKR